MLLGKIRKNNLSKEICLVN